MSDELLIVNNCNKSLLLIEICEGLISRKFVNATLFEVSVTLNAIVGSSEGDVFNPVIVSEYTVYTPLLLITALKVSVPLSSSGSIVKLVTEFGFEDNAASKSDDRFAKYFSLAKFTLFALLAVFAYSPEVALFTKVEGNWLVIDCEAFVFQTIIFVD